MRKDIIKNAPPNKNTTISFEVFEGFESIELVESQMCLFGFYEKQFLIVRFLGRYYGVASPTSDAAIVVGVMHSWGRDAGMWYREGTREFSPPFKSGPLLKGPLGNSGVMEDLLHIDPELQVLNGYKSGWRDILRSYQYASYYADLLGRTFYVSFFTRKTLPALIPYGLFDQESLLRILQQPRIEGVNPFRNEALYVTGRTHRIEL